MYVGSILFYSYRDVPGTTMWQYISLTNSNFELTSCTMHIIKEIRIPERVSICLMNLGQDCYRWKLNSTVFPYFSTIRRSKPQFRRASPEVKLNVRDCGLPPIAWSSAPVWRTILGA